MNCIREYRTEQARCSPLAKILQCGTLLFALALSSALPSYSYSWYSGASVGTDGTVYGWGVTDVTSYTMHHQAYVTTTLTSPKGRKDGPAYGNAQNSVRVDVELPFDASDVGKYLDESDNEGYCYACMCWIVDTGSGASANNAAYPINFAEAGWGTQGCCTLEFTYTWGSSSGYPSDLAPCTLDEYVTSSLGTGTQNWPYPWNYQVTYPIPSPPKSEGEGWYATDGLGSDYILAGNFYTPYAAAKFTDTQIFRYSCLGVNNGNWVTVDGPLSIARSVSQTSGKWQYKVTKADGNLTYNLP